MELSKRARLFLHFLQTFFYPYDSFDYFNLYCFFIRQTVQQKRFVFQAIVWAIHAILCFDLINFLYLSTQSEETLATDDRLLVAHFNYWYLLLGKNYFNFLMVLATANTLYNANCLFLKADYKLVRLLGRILFQRKASFFLYKTCKISTSRARNIAICEHIRAYFSVITNSFKPSILLSNLVMILGNSFTMRKLVNLIIDSNADKHQNTCIIVELLKITAMYLVNSFASIFSLILLGHVFTLIFSIALTLIYVVKIKFRQTDDLLKTVLIRRIKYQLLLETTFFKFRRSYLHTLSIFFRINNMFSTPFATFLVAIFPINLLCGTLILFDKELPLEGVFILGYLGSIHLLCIFLFHVIVAGLSATIHQPRIQLGIIIARGRILKSSSKVSLTAVKRNKTKRLHLSMHLFYCALNVKKTRFYGFMYSNIGLVTMANFFKVQHKLICLI